MLGGAWTLKARRIKIGELVEGYRNTKEVRELAHRFGEMPITEEIYQKVLYCGKTRAGSIGIY